MMRETKKNQKSRGKRTAQKPAPKRTIKKAEARQSSGAKKRKGDPPRISEERLRALIETASDWIWEVDEHAAYTYASPKVKDLLGYEPEEIIGKTPFDLMPPEEVQRIGKDFDACVKARRPIVRLENINLHKDGHPVVLETSGIPIVDAAGRFKGYRGIDRDITGRKDMEEALRKSEMRLRLAQTFGGIGVWSWDVQTGQLNWEPELERLYGLPPGSILTYEDWASHVHPDDLARIEAERDAALSRREPFHLEFRITHGSGEVRWIAAKGSATYDEAGRMLRVLGVNIDITPQKRAVEALRASELRFRTLVEAAPEAIFIQSGGRFMYLNRRMVELFGATTAEELIGTEMFDRFAPESHEVIRQRIKRMRETGQPASLSEQVYLRMDGSRVPVETVAVNFQFEGKDVFIVFVRDISDRKEAEEKLRQSEELFRTIIENGPECVKIIDKDERLVMMNPAGLAMIEADSLDRVRGQKVAGIVSPDYRDAFSKMVRDVLAGNTRKLVFQVTGLKGTRRWLDTVSVPLRDASGGIIALLGVTRDVTEHRRIEQALQESERKYRELVENANAIILRWDVQGRVTFFNEFAQQFFGFTEEEILGKNVVGTIVPATESSGRDLDQLMREICADPEKFRDSENENVTKDGRRVWVHWTNRAILDGAGQPAGVLSIGADETERRKMFAALRESEKRMRLAMAVTRQGFFEIDVRTGDVVVSPEYTRMMGYEPHEYSAVYAKWQDLFQPDERAAAASVLEEYLTGRRDDFQTEFRQQTKSGISRWVLAAGTITGWDHDGNPARILGTFTDITERRLAEEQMLQAEQFRRSMLETVDEGFIIMDRDLRILMANNAFCRQVGIACEEVIGKHCYAVSHKSLRPCYEEGEECAVKRVFETGEPCSAVHHHPDAEGNIMYVETKAFPLKDAEGHVASVIETINNITERYLLEEERLKTQKLEAIGTLAGGIAHDFNNLLQGVFGFVSMAKIMIDRRDKALEMLEQVERALHMSVNLTTQLLTFAKGGMPVKKRVSLRAVIENSVKFALSGSRSDYRIDIAEDLMAVDADEGQVSQVLQNIVLNADQSMPEGGTVFIEAKNVRSSGALLPAMLGKGDYVAIAISDSGIGISRKYLSKIFDPYFTTKEKGSGLGLATSFSIIKNHGGAIDVESETGRGSTFTIYLPAVEPEPEETHVPEAWAGAGKARILIMDDEEMIRMVAGEQLRALGHEVGFAAHGQEAIVQYQKARESGRPFDLVILDLTVRGGMGGAEAMTRLLEIDPGIKAVVSSGYADNDVISRYKTFGFRGALNKPYDMKSLKKMIDGLLQ